MSDMRKLLESMDKFAGEKVGQKPGDQVRGTEKATKQKGNKHPFDGRLVGASESKNMLADLEKELTENSVKRSLAEEFAQYKQQVDEFAPNDGGGSRKFIPWTEFIEQVKQIVGKDFAVKEKIIKSTIQDRFIPHDPMEFGPTMLYSYYEARAGRGKGAVSTRGSIQIGKYFGNSDYFKSNNPELANQLLTSFSLLKGHPFERHFDLTFDNIYKIANIIMGNTQGAYQMAQQQGVAEGVAETVTMDDAVKVLRHYGAGHFKTTSNELHFYKNGQPMSVDLIWGTGGERSVSLSQLNSVSRQLKGQGVAEEQSQPVKYRATVEYGPTAADAHFVTVTATSTEEAEAKVEAWCKKKGVRNPMITINGADKPVVEENYSDEEQPIQNNTAVEAYGYAYNKRDQRVMWRKEFSSQEAAYKWADSKNATVIGIRAAAQEMEESTNPTDVVSVDIPLLIRLLEYSREDAKTDMDLHNVAERLIKLSAGGQTLTMDNYDDICPGQTVDEDVPAPVATAGGVAGATQPSTQQPAGTQPGAAPDPAAAAAAKQNQAKLQQNLANLKTAGVQIDPAKAAQTFQKADTGVQMNAMDKDTISKMAPAIGNVMSNPSTATQLNTLIKKAGGGV